MPENAASDPFIDGFMREWTRHENAPRTPCPECHFEQADCCDHHRDNHAPGCTKGLR